MWSHKFRDAYKLRYAQHIVPLTIRGLMEIASVPPDAPGQGYLFDHPDVNNLRNLRGDAEFKEQINLILDRFHRIFETCHNELYGKIHTDYNGRYPYPEADVEIDTTDEVFQEQMGEFAGSHIGEIDYDKRQQENLLEYLYKHDKLTSAISQYFFKILSRKRKSIDQIVSQIREWIKTDSDVRVINRRNTLVVDEWLEEIIEIDRSVPHINFDDLPEAEIEVLSEKLSVTVTDMIYEMISNNYISDSVPDFIKFTDIKKFIDDHDIMDWYVESNEDYLIQSVSEWMQSSNTERSQEKSRELMHRFGFNVYDVLSAEYDREFDVDEGDDMSRWDMSLKLVSNLFDQMGDLYVSQSVESLIKQAVVLISAIKITSDKNPSITQIFSNELNQITVDPEKLVQGIEEMSQSDPQSIPPEIMTEDLQNFIAARAAEQEEARQSMLTRFREQEEQRQKAIEQQHLMLQYKKDQISNPEILKEKGIAKHPFPHSYRLDRGSFPGMGADLGTKHLEPFQISVSPDASLEIPDDLLRDLSFHRTHSNTVPALGWIGGYADYNQKIMYITEVQSDIMQRTVYMRDPEKVKQHREGEISSLQQQISQIQNAPSAEQQLAIKINKLMTEQQSLAPTDPKFTRNQEIISRLQQQQQNPQAKSNPNEEKLKQLQQRLQEAQQQLNKEIPNADLYQSRQPSKWHDWKSKIENLFKDWIPVFFNVAMREAKARGFAKVRITTADELMKAWSSYSKESTRILFDRVYDSSAKFYNAVPIKDNGKNWFEINMSKNVLVASLTNKEKDMGWFKRASHTKQSGDWGTLESPTSHHKPVWQTYIDTFWKVMKRQLGVGPEINGYALDELNREIFTQWMEQIPHEAPEFMLGDDLHPNFKNRVRQYLMQTQQFDPYDTPEDEEHIPTDDELNAMFG